MEIKVKDNSEEAIEKLAHAKQNALTAIGMTAEGHAKKETPVDTGRLQNSMTYTVKEDAVYIGSNVEYARYVEFGSRHNKNPAHMLQKAATQHSDEYKKLAKEAMENA